jgi:hypothetical protein
MKSKWSEVQLSSLHSSEAYQNVSIDFKKSQLSWKLFIVKQTKIELLIVFKKSVSHDKTSGGILGNIKFKWSEAHLSLPHLSKDSLNVRLESEKF